MNVETTEAIGPGRSAVAPLVWIEAEIGGLRIRMIAGDAGLRAVEFSPDTALAGTPDPRNPILVETGRQLRAYFARELQNFQLPLDPAGTPFQRRVWGELLKIPYGRTRTYGQLAESIGRRPCGR